MKTRAHTEAITLFAIIVIGLSLRIAAIVLFSHQPESDELAYHNMALSIVDGRDIVDHIGNRAMYNVGYPLFVLAPLYGLFSHALIVAQLGNALLGVLSIFMCYAVAREAGAGRVGRLAAAALWAMYLPASVYTVYLFKENLMTPMMLGVIWYALRLTRTHTPQVAMLMGALLGFLALTGNAALVLMFPVLVAIAASPAKIHQKARTTLIIIVTATVVVSPWMIRNLHVLGAPILNTNGGFNLYLGNNPAATGMFVSIADTPRGVSWAELRKEGEVKSSQTLGAEAVSWIQEHPERFIELAALKLRYFWTPPLHQGKGPASPLESFTRHLWAIQFITLAVLSLASMFILSLRTRQISILWLTILVYTAVHMLFYVIFRYREPIMPFLCILAGFTLQVIAEKLWVRADNPHAISIS